VREVYEVISSPLFITLWTIQLKLLTSKVS
jgi:hypothetical protein